ncbi:MAG: site-2 protease family protein [Clostridia bacterium]|nr:site-2 protease family protein [Clostridia bacterium]
MLSQLLSGDKDALISLLLSIPVILFSLSFHEAAHGYIAYKMGDPTAKNLGRVTLNPIKHLDPIGALCMLIFGYGWARPVPIVTRNFDNPRKGMAITGIAGPISNLILGIISTVIYVAFNVGYLKAAYSVISSTPLFIIEMLMMLFYVSAFLNFGLMAFNLIPVPPFDGSRFFYFFLPEKLYFKIMKYEQIIMIVVLVGFFALSRAGYSPISIVSNWLFDTIAEPLWNLGTKLVFGW